MKTDEKTIVNVGNVKLSKKCLETLEELQENADNFIENGIKHHQQTVCLLARNLELLEESERTNAKELITELSHWAKWIETLKSNTN